MEGMEQKKILTVAFDGMHRAGKGTQIELLKNELQETGIPCISIRGEGYRSGLNSSQGDPKTDFWVKMSEQLKKARIYICGTRQATDLHVSLLYGEIEFYRGKLIKH